MRSDCRSASCGASSGAATAIRKSAATNASATAANHGTRRRGAASAGTETGIEDAIEHVDEEVHHDEGGSGEEHRALHDRVVAVVDRLNGEPSDAGPREHRLGDDRPGE